MNNIPTTVGAATINSTNVYPDMERWKMIDIEGKYEDIYNRYAHIKMFLTNEDSSKFELLQDDYLQIDLSTNDLKTLNVKYILTCNDLSQFENNDVKFKELYSEQYKIYEISYLGD